MKGDLPKREPGMLALWESEKIYEKALERRRQQKAPKFVLHDGPPYANGHLHLGHALNKILKDMIVRFKTMAGFEAPYVPGWDCHGLPIELQLLKELKLDKHKIERAALRTQAAAFAQKFVDIQREEFKRMGVLGDWEHPYLTMNESYKKVIVETFEELKAKGYVYRGKKPVYWCSTDETALAEAEVEYENDPGPSIYVAFPGQLAGSRTDVEFVIWTTTPWTLPANVAIAYNPDESYVLFHAQGSHRKLVVAEKRLEEFQKVSGLQGQVLSVCSLEGAEAKHPWIARPSRVVPADFVAMDTGTGLVHIAPGHGMEDYQLGLKWKLDMLSPVDDRGRFTDEVPEWKGLHVFKANPLIIEFLKERNLILHSEEITHSYPHCWRCHRPVIFRATEQWFLKVDHEALRERLLKALRNVTFYPEFGRNRMIGMIQSRPDWCLSRQRYWGTEIPTQGKENSRLAPDIFDVWFESGVSWNAVLKASKDLSYPADLYLEGSDQHRGWFQVSLIPSVALENQAPFKALLTHGFVVDGDGRPMSKSKGNVIAPEEIIKQYGADVLRLWVASSDYSNDVRLSPEILKGLTDTYRKVRNTFRYLVGSVTDFDVQVDRVAVDQLSHPIDRWALDRLEKLVEEVSADYDAYQFHRVVSKLVQYCSLTLSGFYLDMLKDRLYCDATDSHSRRSAQTVLWEISDVLFKLWAPILSFTSDEVWRSLGHAESVGLQDLPSVSQTHAAEPYLTDAFFGLRDKVLEALEGARQQARIKGNLEAKVILYLKNDALKRYESEWSTLLLVSQVEISTAALPAIDVETPDAQIHIERVPGVKCARCWIYKKDIGVAPLWPDVCGRCASVLEGLSRSGQLAAAELSS